MEGLKTPYWYTVYLARDDSVVVCGNARYCAKALGCSESSFRSLVAHVKKGTNKKYCVVVEDLDNCTYRVYGKENKGKPHIDEAKAKGLYAEGMNDVEMAKELGVKVVSIGSWRKRRGFPPNGKQGRPRRRDVDQ